LKWFRHRLPNSLWTNVKLATWKRRAELIDFFGRQINDDINVVGESWLTIRNTSGRSHDQINQPQPIARVPRVQQ
jgi:hypothetical protein